MTREAVIVSTARTGLAKSGRGGFNMVILKPPLCDFANPVLTLSTITTFFIISPIKA